MGASFILGYAAAAVGARLEPLEYPVPTLGEHDVRVAVSHCGLCYTDVQAIDDFYRITAFPFVPGHEIVGRVEACGSAVTEVREGDRVGVGWQGASCGQCRWCRCGEVQLCYDIAEMGTWRRHGGLADSVTVDASFAHPLPDAIASADAAVLMCAGVSVYAPLRRHGNGAARVGVFGLGGLGHLAIQFAHELGHEVTAFSTAASKEGEALAFGADRFVVTGDRKRMHQLDFELDLAICTAHGAIDWDQMIEPLEKRGCLVLVGFPAISLWARDLVAHEVSITGSFLGSPSTMREMLAFAGSHAIRPQVERLPMSEEDVNAAVRRLREGSVRYRIVLEREAAVA